MKITKLIQAISFLFLLTTLVGILAGCTQVIIEQKGNDQKLQINAFLMTTGLETLYYEPNSIFEVGKYRGIPSDVEFEIDPLTKTLRVKTRSKK